MNYSRYENSKTTAWAAMDQLEKCQKRSHSLLRKLLGQAPNEYNESTCVPREADEGKKEGVRGESIVA